MEKDHYYSNVNHLQKVGMQSDLMKRFINDDILKPSNKNTGIGTVVTKPTQTVTLTKPVTADPPVILVPNVEGGLKVENPSPINVMGTEILKGLNKPETSKVITSNIPISNTTLPTIQKQAIANNTSKNLQAGFTLPNWGIMVGMVVAVIVFYFMAKKKS